jgi:putative membrane protein
MKKVNLLWVAIVAAGMLGACSGSGNKTSSNADSSATSSDSSKMSGAPTDSTASVMADTAFTSKAAISGMAEVALGKKAAAKGTDNQVKDFGKMMVMDHGKANAELISIAKSKNITLPAGLDAEHQAKSDSLSKLSGKDFDNGYVQVMIEGHQKTLALMQSEATNGKDADLKAFADKTAPVVQTHLTKITAIQVNLK